INGSSDQVRSKVMPVNRQFSMEPLKKALLAYQASHPKRTLLFEYVLLAGVTDLPEMADELAQFSEGFLDLRINVIPYNPQSRATFKTPTPEAIKVFMERLKSFGLHVYLRGTKGEKEMAACGQLGNLSLRAFKLEGKLATKMG
ncbi:MAG: 23S rRNA (adenine(2503)-C2)-methyltransferase, partial [Chlamydiia bacterium]